MCRSLRVYLTPCICPLRAQRYLQQVKRPRRPSQISPTCPRLPYQPCARHGSKKIAAWVNPDYRCVDWIITCLFYVLVPICVCPPCMSLHVYVPPYVCPFVCMSRPCVYPLRAYVSFVCISPMRMSLHVYVPPCVWICQPSSSHHKILPRIAIFTSDRFPTATGPFGEDEGILLRIFVDTETRVIDVVILFHHVRLLQVSSSRSFSADNLHLGTIHQMRRCGLEVRSLFRRLVGFAL